VVERLGSHVKQMREGAATDRGERQGVEVFTVKDYNAHRNKGGLPVVRMGKATIKAPVDDVAQFWWNINARKTWDPSTNDSQLVKAMSNDCRLVYLQGKPKAGGMISSRDTCYTMHRLSGRVAGSVIFVQVNERDGVPTTKASVRGSDVNSYLMLEPEGPVLTKA
ncbi:unnamed protein product, partial [Chrysoparadoxa australica]